MAYGIQVLKSKLAMKKIRAGLRYDYYEMKISTQDMPMVQNSRLMWLHPVLGWCSKAVDTVADRLQVKGWKNDNFGITEIFQMNNADVLFDSAILSALITSCSFIYIYKDETGFPSLQVIDGEHATGIIDPQTNLLEEGYAVLRSDDNGTPTLEAYFGPGFITYYPAGAEPYTIENNAPYPLLVPIIYRPDSKRPFGHSRISRAMMSIVEGAIRTVKRSEIAAEFYSFPQRYVVGTDADAVALDKWKATISTLLEITKDEDGDKPSVGQFSQQSMQPHLEQIRNFASLFAGETGLTMDDLGFVSENPSSAEAIKASHESLRVLVEKAQRTFASCFLNVGYLATCLRDKFPYERRQFYLTSLEWMPAFKPDAAALSSIGDGAIKVNQAVPGYFNFDNLEILTGIAPSSLEPPKDSPPQPVVTDDDDEDEDEDEPDEE